jgi:hypothetical protein
MILKNVPVKSHACEAMNITLERRQRFVTSKTSTPKWNTLPDNAEPMRLEGTALEIAVQFGQQRIQGVIA